MERKDIPVRWKWKLTRILGGQTISGIHSEIADLGKKLAAQKDTLLNSYDEFHRFHVNSERFNLLESRLGVYYYNLTSQDTRNNQYLSDLLKFQQFLTDINQKLCWIRNKLFDNEVAVRKYCVKDLAIYQEQYDRFYLFKNHRVSDESEQLLNQLQPAFHGYSQLFSTLTSSDFKFKDTADSKGKKHLLTNGTYYDLFTSQDDVLRKNAYQNFWSKYYTFRNTLGSNYHNNVFVTNKLAGIYHYKSALESELAGNFLDGEFFNTLLKIVSDNAPLVQQYHGIICRLLRNDDPKPWEFSKPLFSESTKKYEIEEGIKIIFAATKVLGQEYHNVLSSLFDNNVIDLLPNIGKRQGAYSYSTYKKLPYICMNWTGRFNDVSTLIHEIGHAAHSVFSDQEQPVQYHSYPIFLAEIASTVNELLLFKHMFKETNSNNTKLNLLEKVINLYKSTVYRQAMFADFELFAHNYVSEGGVLTADVVQATCKKISDKFYPKLKSQKYTNKYCGLWGLFVPHFYSDYYVYKYASSMICATIIVSKIEKDQSYVSKYCWFLKQGCRFKPLKLLAKMGIDLKNNDVYQESFRYFKTLITEFEKLSVKEGFLKE